jgi:multiple sugar transport system ATP-binding protein
MPNVRFEHVSKVFGEHVVVRDLNFEIKEGEFLVFVGPSGCGKTTTLRMLSGIEIPSYGRIWIGDQDVTLAPPGKRDISMVFQSYALFPHMSVYKNLAFGPEVRGMSRSAVSEQVHKVAEVLHLDKLLHRRPAELSGGQRQRVALGRTLIRQPKIFLLDEPLSNLDAALRTSMRAEIIDLQRRLAVTTVYVTHDQVEAMTMGDRIAVFKDGVILQIDTPRQLYQNPVNKFVACFVGAPKMNIAPGQLSIQGSDIEVRVSGSTITLPAHRLNDSSTAKNCAVEVGFRPQDLFWGKDAPERCRFKVRGTIAMIETTGPETFVTVDTADARLNCKFPAFAGVSVGETVELAFDANDVYLFDRETERNLLSHSDRLQNPAVREPVRLAL